MSKPQQGSTVGRTLCGFSHWASQPSHVKPGALQRKPKMPNSCPELHRPFYHKSSNFSFVTCSLESSDTGILRKRRVFTGIRNCKTNPDPYHAINFPLEYYYAIEKCIDLSIANLMFHTCICIAIVSLLLCKLVLKFVGQAATLTMSHYNKSLALSHKLMAGAMLCSVLCKWWHSSYAADAPQPSYHRQ